MIGNSEPDTPPIAVVYNYSDNNTPKLIQLQLITIMINLQLLAWNGNLILVEYLKGKIIIKYTPYFLFLSSVTG